MFCYQCEQTNRSSAQPGCSSAKGNCGKDATTADLQDLLVYAIEGIAQYSRRARSLGAPNNAAGAFILYGIQTLAELAINKDDAPLFVETGLRLSYSGKAFGDPNGGGELYRDAYLAGLRFAVGFDRPGMDIGLAAEGGYIDVFLRSLSDPTRTFDFKGGYLVTGPMVRFGRNDPWSFSLEFLNGTSNHPSIGWISKSRMSLQYKVGEHLLVGGQMGAVFYDLHFLDGLGLRAGNFNRDLSLVWGVETGWEF